MPNEEQRLRNRETRLVAEIERRKTNSQRQADMALGRNRPDDEDGEPARRIPLTVTERQARAALGRDS